MKGLGYLVVGVEKKIWERTAARQAIVAYELYCRDESGSEHLIGILPERRKNPDRITEASILNWGREVIGDNLDGNNIYFVKVEW